MNSQHLTETQRLLAQVQVKLEGLQLSPRRHRRAPAPPVAAEAPARPSAAPLQCHAEAMGALILGRLLTQGYAASIDTFRLARLLGESSCSPEQDGQSSMDVALIHTMGEIS